jgi:hypothetical protein
MYKIIRDSSNFSHILQDNLVFFLCGKEGFEFYKNILTMSFFISIFCLSLFYFNHINVSC